jgi:hypothetical protein
MSLSSFSRSFVALTVAAAAFVAGCSSAEDSSAPAADEAPPATTSQDLLGRCHWVRSPGPCPVAAPGGGALPVCYPALYGDAHWSKVCGEGPPHGCPAGEVWDGAGCIPNM